MHKFSKWKRWILILILILAALYPFLDKNDYRLYVANRALIHSILVLGLVFLTGFAGQISLGQAGFYAIGAYTSAYLTTKLGMPIPVGILFAILLSSGAGILLSFPSFKLEAFFLSLVTIAFGQIVYVLILNLQPITGGPYGFFGIPFMRIGNYNFDNKAYFYTFLIILLISFLFFAFHDSNSFVNKESLSNLHRESLIVAKIATKESGSSFFF